MGKVITIGLDIAKHVFQVHGVDEAGVGVVRRKLRRSDVLAFFEGMDSCLVGIEACATAHYWARSIMALGHRVKLMPPTYVKPYVKRQKNDAADAEAICEAVTRPTMRFVPVKGEEQQGILVLHRTRELLIRQRTMLINALRGHLAEFGVVMRQGRAGVATLATLVEDDEHDLIPVMARDALLAVVDQLRDAHDGSAQSNARSSCGTVPMHRAEDWRRFRESVRSQPAPSQRQLRMQAFSALDESWPPGSDWSHDRTPVAARRGSVTSARKVMVTSGACL